MNTLFDRFLSWRLRGLITGNSFVIIALLMVSGCQNNTSGTDSMSMNTISRTITIEQVFETAKQTANYTWYKRSDVLLSKSAKSGHSEPFQRTRYNATAAMMLDANGKVKEGAVFAEGSIITKELVNADRSNNGYALMLKRKEDANADADGWVWGYVTATGTARLPLTAKGSGCIGCHSIAGHIDRTLMNVSHP
jgi:hypothetical protein